MQPEENSVHADIHHDVPVYDRFRGTGPTLVFLHYWGGSGRTWNLVFDHLGDRDRLAVDFRGWGRSHTLPGPFTLDHYASDVLAVIGDAGIEQYVLVGHSMGGKVAQLVGARRPAGLRGLVLVAPAPAVPSRQITAEYQRHLAHAYDTADSVAGVRDTVLTSARLSDELRAQVVEDSRASATGARDEWPLRGIGEDIADRTRLVSVPTLVIGGEHDRVEPVEVLHENLLPYLKTAESVVVPGAGHLLPLEAPTQLSGLIREFVVRV